MLWFIKIVTAHDDSDRNRDRELLVSPRECRREMIKIITALAVSGA